MTAAVPESPAPSRARAAPDALDRFGTKLGQMSRLWRGHIERVLKPLGVSLVQWQVLSHLAQCPELVVQRQLATAIGIEEPALVGVLDRLQAAGLVQRQEAEHDRRAKTLHLTPAALETLSAAEVELRAMRETLLSGLEARTLEDSAGLFDVIGERLLALARTERGS